MRAGHPVPSKPVEFSEHPETVTVPESVTIGPHTYQVRSDPDTARLLNSEGKAGDSYLDGLLIRLDPTHPHTAVADTLLHEALHCMWDQMGLSEVDGLADHEEHLVTSLAPVLLSTIRANPALVDFLTR